MPWLSMYLVDRDVKSLCATLNDDPEIALIVPDGPRRWRAQRPVPKLADGQHALWHIPSGPIELESTRPKGKPAVVRDPFKGWATRAPEVEHGAPWFGPGPLGIIFLTVRRKAGPASRTFTPMFRGAWTAPANRVIGRSDFYWVGDHFGTVSKRYRAPQVTRIWWQSLRRRVAKLAVQVPSEGPLDRGTKSIWAFPGAVERIRHGALRADNP